MSSSPSLINYDRALILMDDIPDPGSREAVRAIVDGIVRFFEQQPSQLRSPFDLAFFVEILKDRLGYVRTALDGTNKWPLGGWEEEEVAETSIVEDPEGDILDSGIRFQQAWNYIARCQDQRVQGTLLTLRHWAQTRQSGRSRFLDGRPVIQIRPDAPFDYLFMVVAIEHVLRPGQPARLLLESGGRQTPEEA